MKIKIKRLARNTATRVRAGCWVRSSEGGDLILWAGAGRSRRIARVALKERVALTGRGIRKVFPC